MRNVADKSCSDNQNKHFVSNNFFSKIEPLWGFVEKCGRARKATDDNMAHAHCMLITKATDTHWQYVIFIPFPLQYGCPNAPKCYVVRKLLDCRPLWRVAYGDKKCTVCGENVGLSVGLRCDVSGWTVCWVLVWLGTEFIDSGKSSNKRYFNENRPNESQTVLKVVNEFLLVMSA